MKRTAIPRRNFARAVKQFKRNFGSKARVEWIRSLACAFCGGWNQVRNAHMEGRKMGGCGGDYTKILPVCLDCDNLWARGRETFLRLKGLTWVDVEAKLAVVYAAWEHHLQGEA